MLRKGNRFLFNHNIIIIIEINFLNDIKTKIFKNFNILIRIIFYLNDMKEKINKMRVKREI